jgi:F-type H+-transporting ATPase subunit a
VILGLEFPPISHLINWPDFWFKDSALAVNKVVLLMWVSALLVIGLFVIASRPRALVPKGVQNFAESITEFIRDGIVLENIGPEGLHWTPFLTSLFVFIFTCNIWGIVPFLQMPVNARMALPMFMALIVWLLYNFVGMKSQGPLRYFTNIMFPPGVPKALYVLVAPIELVSTIFVRPLSLMVRLFANMLAGHLVLVTFAIITASLVDASALPVILPFSFGLLIALTGFEVLVAVLQAFIFTILAAVYIGGALHPEH